jgi:hypothetical protein
MAAIRCDPDIRAWCQRLRDRGKAAQSATCAVGPKMLRQLMGKLRAQQKEAHGNLMLLAA